MPPRTKYTRYVDLKRPTIFAHRGSSAHAPENTLAAFKLAIEQGADGIELDAKLSVDGHVIVMHDETVDRTTNGTGLVKSQTRKELTQLDAGSKYSIQFKDQKIPALDEVFNEIGEKVVINVELTNFSSPRDDLPDKVISLVKQQHLESSVILSSFNFLALIRARYLLPKIPLAFLIQPGIAESMFRTRIVRFGPLLALHPAFSEVTPQLIQTAHQASCRIHTYTVNQPEDMRQLFSAGVDGIFTDDPVLARNVLDDHILNQP